MTNALKNYYYLWVRVTTSAAAAAGNAIPTTPSTAEARFTGRPPRAADRSGTLFWVFDGDFDGVQKGIARIDYSPVIGDRTDAINWLTTRDGAAWISQAETYELLSFATP